MSTLTTSETLTRSQPIWRFVVVGLLVAMIATGATIAITSSGGGATGSQSQSASQKSAVSDLQSYAPDYAGRRPPVAQAAPVETSAPTQASAAQLRQYIGNHGEPRPVVQQSQSQSSPSSSNEPQTSGQRP